MHSNPCLEPASGSAQTKTHAQPENITAEEQGIMTGLARFTAYDQAHCCHKDDWGAGRPPSAAEAPQNQQFTN